MTTDPTPEYDKDTHPVKLWNSWFIQNKAELKRIKNESNSEANSLLVQRAKTNEEELSGVTSHKDKLERLLFMKYDPSCEYDNIFGKDSIWSPLLSDSELKALKSQIIKFYGENKDRTDIGTRSPSPSNESVSLKTDLTKGPSIGELDNAQPPTTNQHEPPHTDQSQKFIGRDQLDQAFLDELEDSGFYDL